MVTSSFLIICLVLLTGSAMAEDRKDGPDESALSAGTAERYGMKGMVARRRLSTESLKKFEETAACVPVELRSPKVIAEETMLRGLKSAPPASRHDPSNTALCQTVGPG